MAWAPRHDAVFSDLPRRRIHALMADNLFGISDRFLYNLVVVVSRRPSARVQVQWIKWSTDPMVDGSNAWMQVGKMEALSIGLADM